MIRAAALTPMHANGAGAELTPLEDMKHPPEQAKDIVVVHTIGGHERKRLAGIHAPERQFLQ